MKLCCLVLEERNLYPIYRFLVQFNQKVSVSSLLIRNSGVIRKLWLGGKFHKPKDLALIGNNYKNDKDPIG